MILEHLDVHVRSVSFAEALDELDFAVNTVIVANESADKTDNDGFGRGNAGTCSLRLRACLEQDKEQKNNQEPNPQRGKHAHRDRKLHQYRLK
jgi:hypothetical protein